MEHNVFLVMCLIVYKNNEWEEIYNFIIIYFYLYFLLFKIMIKLILHLYFIKRKRIKLLEIYWCIRPKSSVNPILVKQTNTVLIKNLYYISITLDLL